jgi:integrase
MRSFAQIMSATTSGAFQPRDLRRSYARLLADAGIPEYRQATYMGHAVHTITAHYQVGDVTGYLTEDAARLAVALERE